MEKFGGQKYVASEKNITPDFSMGGHAKIYQFSDMGIKEISYEETEHFRVTKDFLNNYQKRIQQLLEKE